MQACGVQSRNRRGASSASTSVGHVEGAQAGSSSTSATRRSRYGVANDGSVVSCRTRDGVLRAELGKKWRWQAGRSRTRRPP